MLNIPIKQRTKKAVRTGGSIIDDFIANLPFEAHLVDFGLSGARRYSFCGPGTKLNNRTTGPPDYAIKPHSRPINGLDNACYYHDIAYDKYKDTPTRNVADDILYKRALDWERKQGDKLSTADKTNLWIVKTVMGNKVKHGVGMIDNDFPVMSVDEVKTYLNEIVKNKVSKVARGPNGFLTNYLARGEKMLDEKVPGTNTTWRQKRNQFIKRTLAQYNKKPTHRRGLSLIAWAYNAF